MSNKSCLKKNEDNVYEMLTAILGSTYLLLELIFYCLPHIVGLLRDHNSSNPFHILLKLIVSAFFFPHLGFVIISVVLSWYAYVNDSKKFAIISCVLYSISLACFPVAFFSLLPFVIVLSILGCNKMKNKSYCESELNIVKNNTSIDDNEVKSNDSDTKNNNE
ncbi:MAG: hypothetical protein LBJ93_00430 [Clostridiales bacterium]|jgi:hypothetical protein|nr:hypothetical protein [Clostridiales bacterium]